MTFPYHAPRLGHMKFPPIKDNSDKEALIGVGAVRPDEQASPRLVIRGESISSRSACPETYATKISFIDYLAFTVRGVDLDTDDFPLREILIDVFNIPPLEWKSSHHGWNGYTHRVDLGSYGLVAYGGKSQKGSVHVQINGQGCKQVNNWERVFSWGVSQNTKITRVDIAHDDFAGKIVSISKARTWLDEGLFNSQGRPPIARLYDDFDSGSGKTLYIGSRKSGKILRIYEKGRQLKDPSSPWCRVELELRSKDRVIDWDVILNPDGYLAGAYPALNFLSERQSVITTSRKERAAVLNATVQWCRQTCGPLINLLCMLYDEDIPFVVRQLRRPGIPKRLEAHYKEELIKLGLIP